jgi:delta14-sterol reductase
MKLFLGLITPLAAYAMITLLHIIIPVKKVKGYVKNEKTGELMNYRTNGKFVLLASILIWFLLGHFNIVPYVWLYETRWLGLIGACVIGLAFSFTIVLKHPSTGKSFFADFWFGRVKDAQLKDGFMDAKLWFYLIGAVMLQLNVLSFAAYHIMNVQNINYGFLLGCAMLTWFCFDYLVFEKIHLWTYDFIAERVGFKLGFGCLAFYPYFYAVSLWFTANLPNPGHPIWLTILFGALYLCGWVFTRGSNMQKYFFKTSPGRKFLWIEPKVLSDGKLSLLANGYWGTSTILEKLYRASP